MLKKCKRNDDFTFLITTQHATLRDIYMSDTIMEKMELRKNIPQYRKLTFNYVRKKK